MGARTAEGVGTAMKRTEIIDLLNGALSAEYNSFIGHALASNPYVAPEWESDLKLLEELRGDENDLARALIVQLANYRAGPTIEAFRHWKEDLNFLSLEWLVIRASEEAVKEVARVEATIARLPDDAQLRATFATVLATKKRHAERLAPVAAKRRTERAARRAVQHAVTAVKVAGIAAPGAAPAAAAGGGAAPAKSGGPTPKLPAGFKLPAGAPKAPTPPGGAPKAPPLPPGAAAPAAPTAPAAPPQPAGGAAPPLPPGFKLPKK